jgi:hypothetical protein
MRGPEAHATAGQRPALQRQRNQKAEKREEIREQRTENRKKR